MRIALALLTALLLAPQAGSVASAEARAARQPPAAPPAGTSSEAGPTPRRVLAVYWYGPDHQVTATFDRQFQTVLKQQAAGEVVRYTEYLQPGFLPDEQQSRVYRDYLRQKYAERKIDVLFCWGSATLRFLLQHRETLFPGTPIVYYASSIEAVKDLPAVPMTGVLNPGAYARTLDLALRLHPDTTHVFVISGTVGRDKSIEREATPQLARFQAKVTLTYLTDLPLERLIATVRALPSRSVILYSRQSHEDPDRVLQAFDFLGPVSQAASVPVYAPWRSHLGAGVVGGVVDDPVAGATNAAEMVLRVARGARPEDVPTGRVPTSPAFDARQLARFGIAEDELPPGSTVLFREPTVWSRYWPYVLGTFVVVGLQALLIGALLFQRARRRRVESALRESEERFRVMADTAPVLIWRSNTTKACDFFNSPWLEFRGRSLEEESGWGWSLGIHPDDRDEYVATYSSAFDRRGPFSVESRLQRADGEYRWVMCTGIPRLTGDGSFAGYIGSVVDITDRKRAELNLETTRHELARVARVTSLAQCAAHTAHELSQPLASIQMNVGACLRWLKGPSVPTNELHGALLDAATAASMASGIIAREREMFRRHSVEKQALDANGIATEVVSLLRARLEHTGTRLGLRLAPDLPPVRGNRVELQQVLLNLLLNGIEAMETVGQADRRLTIETRLAGDMVQTTVEDTGPGVRDADVEHLFKPFSTTKPSGTGIGLSISRLIVEHHDGSIWVDRNSSRGARFHFTVPVAAEEVTGPVAGAATRRSPQEAPGRAARAS